ncbi:MAG: class I SAM-dependent methyltransferase [Candidatus Hodarchaeota archaeon]
MTNRLNRKSWNRLSEYYQQHNLISLSDVHYGPFAPGEREEQLLGDIQGKKVLELGCGGGQNAIVLAKWGASRVCGVDQSAKQLEHARSLARQENVAERTEFLEANVESIQQLEDETFDLIISSHALNYVEDLQAVFRECKRLLRAGGRAVLCLGHPIVRIAWEALEEDNFSILQEINYFERNVAWNWDLPDGQKIPFESRNWNLEDIINGLINAGLRLEKVREPKGYDARDLSPKEIDQIPYRWETDPKFFDLNQKLPYSLIVVAKKLD